MNPTALTRILTGCSFNVQRNLFRFARDGRKAVRAFEKRRRQNRPFFPPFLMLSVTNRCNLRCRGCWVDQTSGEKRLSLGQMQGIIDTAARYDARFFGILGGEPLFHPDLWTIFERNRRAYFQLFTNGTRLDFEASARLAKVGNVTPLISIEGLENESRVRRGGDDVFARSLAGLDAAVGAGLFVGAAASINRRNIDELASDDYLDFLVRRGVHYLWYYIYRPCGNDPDFDAALNRDQILRLRRFIVQRRKTAKLILLDAYWDGLGRAVCPGAMGLSHHIAPSGAVEFCPVIQFATETLDQNGSNLETIFQRVPFLEKLRDFCAERGRGCVFMESPRELADFLREQNAEGTVGRDGFSDLWTRPTLLGHDIPGEEIPERSFVYRLAKKYYFFGFGAYG